MTIQHDQRTRPIGAQEAHRLQIVGITRGQETTGAYRRKTREVRHIEERSICHQLALVAIVHQRRFAEVAGMVRPALLIEQQIPIDESGSARVQAAYDGMRILLRLALLRGLALFAPRILHATFGEQQLLVRPTPRHLAHLLEMVARIPMERNTRKGIGGHRALGSPAGGGKRKLPRLIHRRPEGGLNARQYLVGVVIPSEQLHIAMPRRIQRRTQIRCRELSFLFRTEQARIPRLACHRLVLHAHTADAHALASICIHVFRQHLSPCLILRTTQLATPVHAAVGLHERRRAPGACE